MSLGGGYSQSESDQRSQSFGPLGSISGTARGQAQNTLSNLLFGRGAGQFAGTGFGEGGVLGDLRARTQAPAEYQTFNYQTPTLTPTGLYAEQEAALRTPFQQAVEQALGRTSGNYAMRGFNRPENIQAIAGSAAQNVAPQFANLYATLAGQNVAQRTQAPLIQEQQTQQRFLTQEDVTRQRFTDLLNALGINVSALGGQATSLGTSKSMGVQASGSVTGGGEKGTGTIFGA